MKINVSIRLEEFDGGENFDTQLKALLQELANNCQNSFTYSIDEDKASKCFSIETSVNFCYTTLLKSLKMIIQTNEEETKGNLKDCMRFKYKIETSKVERDEANFDQFASYINGIQSITNI